MSGYDTGVPTQSLIIGDQFSQKNVNQSIKMQAAMGRGGDGFGKSNQVDIYSTLALSQRVRVGGVVSVHQDLKLIVALQAK